ncbi:uncharacterized protein LOC120118867 [Hibiscus syriacus]|uniref:uncharacterized protein LOC120118867 n=1 Tax=Hibiscus syriacus TaxID=106335 RepID=UPI001923AD28|nr:uncharacterized protein LOC120118867 [Hibiscus syriacus]
MRAQQVNLLMEEKNATTKVVPPLAMEEVRPPSSFPQRLKKYNDDFQFKKFIDILDQLYINFLLLEAIDQMLTYAKFLKEIVTKKMKVEKYETIVIAKEYCSVLSKLPPKRKDHSNFVIHCSIRDNYVGRSLCDFGSSVNLMPKSVFLKLRMENTRPTTVILQLADRSHILLEGMLEYVIVKVDKFVFLPDFLMIARPTIMHSSF